MLCLCGYLVLGGYLRILCAPSVQSCCTSLIYTSYRVLVCGRYRKSRLCVALCEAFLSDVISDHRIYISTFHIIIYMYIL